MGLGLIVIFLKYAVAIHINVQDKLLKPRGRPTTVSLNNPAMNTRIQSKCLKSFKVKKKIKINGKLKEKYSKFK